jgi:hypothetical protein
VRLVGAIQIHHVDVGESGEGYALAIGRENGLLDEAGLDGGLVDANGKVHGGDVVEGDLGGEGDEGILAIGHVDAVDFATVADDDGGAVGREGVAGEGVAREAAFLIIAGDGELEPALVAGFEITDAQAGFGLVAGAED